MKRRIRLSENDLNRIIRNVISEAIEVETDSVSKIESVLNATEVSGPIETIFENHPEIIRVMAQWLNDNVGEEQLRSEIPGYDYFVDAM